MNKTPNLSLAKNQEYRIPDYTRVTPHCSVVPFYTDPNGNFNEEIWNYPVALFLLGKYPKQILINKTNKNYLHCPICFERLLT